MNNIKYMQYLKDKQCMIKYRTNIKGYKAFWVNDVECLLKDYNCIIIEDIIIPMNSDYHKGVEFLTEFCNIMSIEGKIVIFDSSEFINKIKDNDNMFYDTCIGILEEILLRSSFFPICVDNFGFDDSDIYVYLNKYGEEAAERIEAFYGIYYD